MRRSVLAFLALPLLLALPAAATTQKVPALVPAAQKLLCNARPAPHKIGTWARSVETHSYNGVEAAIVFEGTPTTGAVAVSSTAQDVVPSTSSIIGQCIVAACVDACVGYVIENPSEALKLAKSFGKVSLWAGKKIVGYFFSREAATGGGTSSPQSSSSTPAPQGNVNATPPPQHAPDKGSSGYGKHFTDAQKLDQKIPDNKLHRTYREQLELFRDGGALVVNETAFAAFFKDKKPGQAIGRQGATWLVPTKELKAYLDTHPTLEQLEDKLGFVAGTISEVKDKMGGKVIGKAKRAYVFYVKDALELDLMLPDKGTAGANECYLGGGNICTGKEKAVSFAEMVATAPVPYETMVEYHPGK